MQLAKKAHSYSTDVVNLVNRLLAIFIANLLCAVAYNGFFIPNQLLSGGVGGIAIMIHYLTDLPTGVVMLVVNIPIFIIGARLIDKEFAIFSFLSMSSISLLLGLTDGIHHYIQINDILLEAIFGGLLNGLGMGIMFRNRASQGGMDIIAAIFKKKFNINIGTVLMGVNILIVGSSSLLFGIRPAMYTIIALYIAYQVVDKIQCGLETKKTVVIISDRPKELADAIINKLNRGATFLKGEGAYSRNNKNIIYCTITSTQVCKLKEIADEVDPNAFITINDTEEVKGRGFKNIGI